MEGTTYAVRCSYMAGSNARGCVYFLSNGADNNNNIMTGFIERRRISGVQIDIEDISRSELLAFDWEENNSTSNISVQGTFSVIEECPLTG